MESDICSWSDLEFVDDFYKRIINTTDPLAMLRQAQKIENQQKNIHKKEHDSNSQDENKTSGFDQKNEQRKTNFDNEQPFLHRVWEKIKNFFS